MLRSHRFMELNDGPNLCHASPVSDVQLLSYLIPHSGHTAELHRRVYRLDSLEGKSSWDNQVTVKSTSQWRCSTALPSLRSAQPPQDLKHAKKYWFCRLAMAFEEAQNNFPSMWEKEPPQTRLGLLRNKKCKTLSPAAVTPTCQRHTLPPGKPLQWRISSNMQESKIKTDRQLYRGAVLASGWEGRLTNQAAPPPTSHPHPLRL